MLSWFSRFKREKVEKRSASSGFTSEVMAARESYISGRSGLAELTATTQSCVSLWEQGFALADVSGTAMLDRRTMALIGRSLALRGEALFIIDGDAIIPASDWDVSTRNGRPVAYRASISEAGGGSTRTILAGETLHFRIGADATTPWLGSAPLRRASLTAGLLNSLEAALAEVYENAPIGSMIIPFPESPETDLETLGRGFRGRRGRVLLRESVNVQAAGGPAPAQDWRPSDVSPDLSKAMTTETLDAARNAICCAFGVLPGLFYKQTTGPMVREAQRHLASWTLQPIAELIAEEASAKLGGEVKLDILRPTQSFDAGGAARALSTLVRAMADAKEAGLPPEALAAAYRRLDWES
jgi:hypothetical protein